MSTLTERGEILVALCDECKCCLAKVDGHCWICHTNSTIRAICGCGECPQRADVFLETEAIKLRNRANHLGIKGRI